MAVVSQIPAITQQQVTPALFREYRVPGVMSSSREIVEEAPPRVVEEKIYVAVGKTVKKSKSMLIWVSQYFRGKGICLLHVHQPAQMIPLLGAKFPASALKEQEVRAFRDIEKKDVDKLLDEYLLLCQKMGIRAEKISTDNECIENGILELISEHGIKKLVMGAAEDRRYSRNMELKSKKAQSVRGEAPVSCDLWFVCKGQIVESRVPNASSTRLEVDSSPQQASENTEAGPSSQQGGLDTGTESYVEGQNYVRSQSITIGQKDYERPSNPAIDLFRRAKSTIDSKGKRATTSTTPDYIHISVPSRRSEVSTDESEVLSRVSISQSSVLSTCSSTWTTNLGLIPITISEGSPAPSELSTLTQSKDYYPRMSSSSLLDGSLEDPLYIRLEQAMSEAETLRREAFEEAGRRTKAEKDALEAIRMAKLLEGMCTEESRQRRQLEETLEKEKEELEKVMSERNKVMEELQHALDQKSWLDKQIAESNEIIRELQEKIFSSVNLMQSYKRQRDELKLERDIALRDAEQLRRSQREASSSLSTLSYLEFSLEEIEEATRNFDPSLKIGEGGYGSIYKGVLRHTLVAVKMLNLRPHCSQGAREFQQEVDVLSKIRHPNLITLIGACPEVSSLVYEYLPLGNLEDRLSCKDNTLPLSWECRVRIATELCSVLIFLHSGKPHSIVHGDLKPSNILLDSHFVSKLSDFGTSRLLHHDVCYLTAPKGSLGYVDPSFLESGVLTPKSDVYAFGIILLQLLTGRPALGISKEVQSALQRGNLKSLIDPLAGHCPFVQAEQLAHLALRCCDRDPESRPDLAPGVWKILEPMKSSLGDSPSFRLGSGQHLLPPHYFICPIFQEVMRDPHIAADGYTYEAEALKGWLDSGHDTSPMTNLKLAHCNLVPNHALRSAIQEWLQQQ